MPAWSDYYGECVGKLTSMDTMVNGLEYRTKLGVPEYWSKEHVGRYNSNISLARSLAKSHRYFGEPFTISGGGMSAGGLDTTFYGISSSESEGQIWELCQCMHSTSDINTPAASRYIDGEHDSPGDLMSGGL